MRGHSFRNLAVLVAIVSIVVLGACGGGGGSATVTPPMGNFTNANLMGSYAFSFQGSDGNGSPFVVAGQFTANGSGTISGGAIDLNDFADSIFLSPSTNNGAIQGTSTYSVSADGETAVTLVVTGGTFVLQLTLASNSQGLVSAFGSTANPPFFSGSGTIQLQNTTASLPANLAFALSGVDLINFQEATFAGNLAVSGTTIGASVGDIVATGLFGIGTADERDTTVSGTITADTNNPGRSVVALTSTALGQLATQLNTSATLTFAVYVVDSTHVKIAEIDTTSAFLLQGEGFAAPGTGNQQLAKGNYAYTVSGEAQNGASFSAGGVFTSDGAGHVTGGVQDVHSTSVSAGETLTNTAYSSDATFARIDMKLSESQGTFEYIAYPTSEDSVLMIEIDEVNPTPIGISTGTAYQQSTTSAPTGMFALNITGLAIVNKKSVPDVQDLIGQMTVSGTTVTGDININNLFNKDALLVGAALSSSTVNAPDATGLGHGSMSLNSSSLGNSGYGLMYYTVDGNRVLLLETDSLRVSTGQLLMQTN